MIMATPSTFSADMLKEIAKHLDDYQPRQSLLMSAGLKRDVLRQVPQETRRDNPIFAGITQSFMGLPIETFNIPPEEVIDWSGCRSPSRAKRRHARRIPQRIKIEYRERAYLVDRRALGEFWRGG